MTHDYQTHRDTVCISGYSCGFHSLKLLTANSIFFQFMRLIGVGQCYPVLSSVMLDNVSICTDYHTRLEKTIRYLPAHKNTLFEQNYGKHLDTAEKKNQISTQNTGKGLTCWNDQLMETSLEK